MTKAKPAHVPQPTYASAVEATLAERGTKYGTLLENGTFHDRFMGVVSTSRNWQRLSADQRLAINVIGQKLARILTGRHPDYIDNWHDIQGYAKLVEDAILELDAVSGGQ